MEKAENPNDSYIDLIIDNGYKIISYVDKGKKGKIYKAKREDMNDILACKIIPIARLNQGWEREIEKVVRLRGIPNIVPYHSHGTEADKNNNQFLWVLWDFINGTNLKKFIDISPRELNLAFIENIIETILNVLFACQAVDIQHGDLHERNILIKDPDPRIPGSPKTIWISDFGYGGSHNQLLPKDDFRQLFSVGSNLLKKLNPSDLNPRDRIMYKKLDEFLKKKVMESIVDIKKLIQEFKKLPVDAETESAAARRGEEIKQPGDYLAAEALGNSVEEWRNLFVPEFLAAQDLLSRNITVLTGARGCGKTMVFRRLTAFMDKVINEPSRVKGADRFIGFYLNCRDLAEAFPWLPRKLKPGLQQQIMHFFHLAWLTEICKTLAVYREEGKNSFDWLSTFFKRFFGEKYRTPTQGTDSLNDARDFLETQKENCRLSGLGKKEGLDYWSLARIDFLVELQKELESNVVWINQTPLFFFLDDYTIPIIPAQAQVILNPIIFNRTSKIFFKISSESSNSFNRQGIRGKPLELHNDFELIDLATESLHQDEKDKNTLLEKIFKPRIERYDLFKERNLSLLNVLGKTPWSNNELARKLRSNSEEKEQKEKIVYHGKDVFIGMWSSDIRIMIQMFTEILRDARNSLEIEGIPVKESIQDKIYRDNGGEFHGAMKIFIDPALLKKGITSNKEKTRKYSNQLNDIVEAFKDVSRYELTKGPLVSNQGRENPKQAFRLEIIDKFELSDQAQAFYEGLIRWHIFFQDWRGKSVRGMITPRLYLNRILLPYFNLTFSGHDHIQLTNIEFNDLLTKPKEFFEYWAAKRKQEEKNPGQRALFQNIDSGDDQ